VDRLVRALGAPGDLADAPVQIVSTVHSKVLVGFTTREIAMVECGLGVTVVPAAASAERVRVGPFGSQLGERGEGVLQRRATPYEGVVEHLVHHGDGGALLATGGGRRAILV
jgi:hypothetical protein